MEIDVYEKERIGGRAAVVKIGSSFYEGGASIIHGRNRHLVDIADKFGLEHRTMSDGGKLGIYDGKEFVFRESDSEWLTLLKLWWRYGSSVMSWNSLINDMLSKFERIYKHQKDGYAFTSVQKLLTSMDPLFVNMTRFKACEFLSEMGFGKLFIKELATAVARVNYGQTANISAFVGNVALAAAQGGLWAVKGGNYLLAEVALNASGANVLMSKVDTVTLKEGKYVVSSTLSDVNNNLQAREEKTYDIVVVAAPQTRDLESVKFVGFPHIHDDFPGKYHRTVATFVSGKVNGSYFGLADDDVGDVVNIDARLNYNSVSKNAPVTASDEKYDVFKVFSQTPLSPEDLGAMFSDVREVKSVDWLAYPHYVPPEHLGLFQLHDRLYYTSSIEWIASAMEMSAISAQNVALLAYNHWMQLKKVDSPERMKRTNLDEPHGEL